MFTPTLRCECAQPGLIDTIWEWSIEADSVTSEYPQDGGSVCCCHDYRIEARMQNCMVCCTLRVVGCAVSDSCHAEWEYPQDGDWGKKADGFYVQVVLWYSSQKHAYLKSSEPLKLWECSWMSKDFSSFCHFCER